MAHEPFDLDEKGLNPKIIADRAMSDERLLAELLQGVSPEARKISRRENCSQALIWLSKEKPEILLPHWDYFISSLKCKNGFSKYVAIHVLAELVRCDNKDRFANDFDELFVLLDDESVMVASHVASAAGKIGKSKPDLCSRITRQLLSIGNTHFDEETKDRIRGYVIEGLAEYFNGVQDREVIISFVKQQRSSRSPRTRQKAKEFLKTWAPDE